MVQHQSTLVFTQITEDLCMLRADHKKIGKITQDEKERRRPSQLPLKRGNQYQEAHKHASRVHVPNQTVHERE